MQKIFLIDGNHLIHRSFYAIRPLQTKSGIQTNAVYGFFSILFNLIEREKPEFLAVTFDEKTPTFRHEKHAAYKATRTKAPDELYQQIPLIKELLESLNLPYYSLTGFEADDLLGTFAHQAVLQNLKAFILTGDHDALQLVDDDRILVIFPHKGYREPIIFNEAKVIEKFGVTPQQIVDYKAICGDASDNLKGVEGIGPKGATDLLQKYKTLEEVYRHLDDLKLRQKEKLEQGKESAFHCQDLARIVVDAPLQIKLEDCVLHEFDLEKALAKFAEYELFSLQRRLRKIFETKTEASKTILESKASKQEKQQAQLQLF